LSLLQFDAIENEILLKLMALSILVFSFFLNIFLNHSSERDHSFLKALICGGLNPPNGSNLKIISTSIKFITKKLDMSYVYVTENWM